MAADYTYDYWLAIDNGGNLAGSSSFQFYTVAAGGSPAAMYDMNGSPISSLVTNPNGVGSRFRADVANGYLDNGTFRLPILSTAQQNAVANATAAQNSASASATSAANSATAAQAAQAAAQAAQTSGITGAPTSWPATFPPSSHTHPASQISDASTVGRQVVTAVDGQAARAAIGAGTGNGTSNLTIGTTSSTAAAGNHTHPASTIPFTPTGTVTATDVQAAIVQAAAQGSGGGGTAATSVMDVFYTAGAYEALPATPDPAWRLVVYHGPTAPAPPASGYSAVKFDWQVRA